MQLAKDIEIEMQLAKLRLFQMVGRRAALTCDFALRLIKKLLIDVFNIFLFNQVE